MNPMTALRFRVRRVLFRLGAPPESISLEAPLEIDRP
jgi:hypothetical protein